jgi:hypothetical protein
MPLETLLNRVFRHDGIKGFVYEDVRAIEVPLPPNRYRLEVTVRSRRRSARII